MEDERPPPRSPAFKNPFMTRTSELHLTAGRTHWTCLWLTSLLFGFAVLFAGSARGGRVDFAKYQSVTASGQTSDYGPELAVDGIVSNFHAFRTNNATSAQWLQVTFPRAITIA